ncbi:MAG: phenylacetate--CoA ligase family protein, partial [Methanomicrobiaceae archaeon]|nr:phenylacetate--CoA ligase family protein [Methanomicrobiaceae archaeon]
MPGFWEQLHDRSSFTVKAIRLLPAFRVFLSTYALLQRSQWWTAEEHAAYQREHLARLLAHAYENVPYY